MSTKFQRSAVFQPEFRQDLAWWIKNDRKTALRTMELVEAVVADPFAGIGKPEPLRFELAGCWSRRITQEHRLVYRVQGKGADQEVAIARCRYHY